jgi:hypothetical protein
VARTAAATFPCEPSGNCAGLLLAAYGGDP